MVSDTTDEACHLKFIEKAHELVPQNVKSPLLHKDPTAGQLCLASTVNFLEFGRLHIDGTWRTKCQTTEPEKGAKHLE